MKYLFLFAVSCWLPITLVVADESHNHGAKMVEISESTQIPQVSIQAMPDSTAGWNIKLETTHFRFAPEHVDKEHIAGEGHAHLYVDGEKVARLYGPWFHLSALGQGEHQLRVTLNANNHAVYSLNGEMIKAEIVVKE